MASKKVYIDIVVDDKGTTKRVAVEAKKLRTALNRAKVGAEEAGGAQDKLGENTGRTNKHKRTNWLS